MSCAEILGGSVPLPRESPAGRARGAAGAPLLRVGAGPGPSPVPVSSCWGPWRGAGPYSPSPLGAGSPQRAAWLCADQISVRYPAGSARADLVSLSGRGLPASAAALCALCCGCVSPCLVLGRYQHFPQHLSSSITLRCGIPKQQIPFYCGQRHFLADIFAHQLSFSCAVEMVAGEWTSLCPGEKAGLQQGGCISIPRDMPPLSPPYPRAGVSRLLHPFPGSIPRTWYLLLVPSPAGCPCVGPGGFLAQLGSRGAAGGGGGGQGDVGCEPRRGAPLRAQPGQGACWALRVPSSASAVHKRARPVLGHAAHRGESFTCEALVEDCWILPGPWSSLFSHYKCGLTLFINASTAVCSHKTFVLHLVSPSAYNLWRSGAVARARIWMKPFCLLLGLRELRWC